MPPQEPNTTAPTAVEPFTPAPLKVGKFKASVMIARESWEILRQDKEILWFPTLSIVTSFLALIIMGVLFFYLVMNGDPAAFSGDTEHSAGALDYVLAIVFYTVMFFIANFFQAGIYLVAHARMNGGSMTFRDGIDGAMEAAGKIFVWSLISATVGVVLRAIAERSAIVGRIVMALLGAAWNILTYFSLPALVIGKVSVVDSFKVSAATIRKTWGETIILNIGVGLFFGMLMLAGILLGVGIMMLAPIMPVVTTVGFLMIVYVVVLAIVSSTLGSIFKLALYEYAQTGRVPSGFSPELIENAVKPSK